jgi:2-methylisocitrate lyase-like PEP mutase family enzyme
MTSHPSGKGPGQSAGGRPFSDAPSSQSRLRLRELIARREAFIVPGAANALTARVIEDLGYDAVYVTGAGISNSHLGMPDLGFVSVTELAEAASRINDVCGLPMIVDIDTGFGSQLNVLRTVRMLERAGASALQIEDQVFPKKCGHFDGKGVVPLKEMLAKLAAALDARSDPNTIIIARTDARAVEGFDAAMERALAFIEAGADVTFVEAPETIAEIEAIGRLPGPQILNLVVGGRTPLLSQAELARLGFAMSLYANAALQAALRATQEVLGHLKNCGTLNGVVPALATFAERQRIVAKPSFDELEKRFSAV